MPNQNPIKTVDPGTYTDYVVAKEHAEKDLFLTTTTTVPNSAWKLDLLHTLVVGGDMININPNPDIQRQKIGKCKDLNNVQLALITIATRIRNEKKSKVAKAQYSVLIEAGNTAIDEFTVQGDETNPTTFYTKVKLIN